MENRVAKFEDLIAWQKARELTRRVYEITRTGSLQKTIGCPTKFNPPRFRSCPILQKVLKGAAWVFHQFLSTAKASCAELRSQLYVALDVGYIDEHTFHDLRLQAEEVGRIIGGLRVSVAKQRRNRAR